MDTEAGAGAEADVERVEAEGVDTEDVDEDSEFPRKAIPSPNFPVETSPRISLCLSILPSVE
jgi:hypothetical protein